MSNNSNIPKRRYSYNRAVNRHRTNITEEYRGNGEEMNNGTQATIHEEESTGQEENGDDQQFELNDGTTRQHQSLQGTTSATSTVILRNKSNLEEDGEKEEDGPDPSKMNRASTGSEFSRFQIGFSDTYLDGDDSSSSDELVEEQEYISTTGDVDDDMENGYSTINDVNLVPPVTNDEERGTSEPRVDEDLEEGYSKISDLDLVLPVPTANQGVLSASLGHVHQQHSRRSSEPIVPNRRELNSESDLSNTRCVEGDQTTEEVSEQTNLNQEPSEQNNREEENTGEEEMSSYNEARTRSRAGSLARKNAVRRRSQTENRRRSSSVYIPPPNSEIPPPSIDISPPALPPPVPERRPLNHRSKSMFISNSAIPSNVDTPPKSPRKAAPRYSQQQQLQTMAKAAGDKSTLKLHNPKNAMKLRKYLRRRKYDQVERDQFGNTALHSIIRSRRKDKRDLLMVLMIYSDFGTEEIDIPDGFGETALHMAVQIKDFDSTRVLLTFGANINALNNRNMTPLDLVMGRNRSRIIRDDSIWQLLLSLDAISGRDIKPVEHTFRKTANIFELKENFKSRENDQLRQQMMSSVETADKLEEHMNELFRSYEEIADTDLQYALGLQQFELKGWRTTADLPLYFQQGGKRILFLDGGGVRGLIQIEILSMLEKKTGRKVTEMFDWIVGTSTGGIVALGLVYGEKSLAEIRQFYFRMKSEVFTKGAFNIGQNINATVSLEVILKETLSENMRMSDKLNPKVLVAAVDKTTTNPKLIFFNNCLDNEFSNELIWKVARYTSAAPMYFSELDGYTDGGVLANNPADCGLTEIQRFFHKRDQRLDLACVVSLGSGTFPAKALGNINVHELLGGASMLNVRAIQQRATNLMTLLSQALVNSEGAVENCKARCEVQKVPFYRFSPKFECINIDSDEIDDGLLIEMLITTKTQALVEWSEQFDELEEIFEKAAEESRQQKLKILRERRQKRLEDSTHMGTAFSQ